MFCLGVSAAKNSDFNSEMSSALVKELMKDDEKRQTQCEDTRDEWMRSVLSMPEFALKSLRLADFFASMAEGGREHSSWHPSRGIQ